MFINISKYSSTVLGYFLLWMSFWYHLAQYISSKDILFFNYYLNSKYQKSTNNIVFVMQSSTSVCAPNLCPLDLFIIRFFSF